jgi:hypothetical protein
MPRNSLSISTSAAAAASPSHARSYKTEASSPHARSSLSSCLVPISPSKLTHGVSKFGRSTTRPALSKRARDEEATESDESGGEEDGRLEHVQLAKYQVRPTEMQPVPLFEGSEFVQVTAIRPHPRSTRLKFKLRIQSVGLPEAVRQSLKDGARQIALARRRQVMSSSSSDDENVLVSRGCSVCGGIENPGKVLMCDGCDNEVHMYCMSPPLRSVPKGRFDCPSCMDRAGRAFAASAAVSADCYIAGDLDGDMRRVCHGPDGFEISLTANLATNPAEDRKSRRRGMKRERTAVGAAATADQNGGNALTSNDASEPADGSAGALAEQDGPKNKKRRRFFTHQKHHSKRGDDEDDEQEQSVNATMDESMNESPDDPEDGLPLSSLLNEGAPNDSAMDLVMDSDTESEGLPIEVPKPIRISRGARSQTPILPSSALSIAMLDVAPSEAASAAAPSASSAVRRPRGRPPARPTQPVTAVAPANDATPSTPSSTLRRTPRLSNATPTQPNDAAVTKSPVPAPVTTASNHLPTITSRPLRSAAVAPTPTPPAAPAAVASAAATPAPPRPRGPGRLPSKKQRTGEATHAPPPPPMVVNVKASLRRNEFASTPPETASPTASSPNSMPGLAAPGDSTTQSESTTSSTASSIGAAEATPIVTVASVDFDTPMIDAVPIKSEIDVGDAMVDGPQAKNGIEVSPEIPSSRRPARSAASAANMRMQFGGLSEKQSLKLLHVD